VRIQPLLKYARRQTKPRTHDLYEVFCAVLYVLRSGCQLRMLPEGFPKSRSTHAYFQLWSEERDGQTSILETVLKKLVRVVRTNNGRTENTRGRTLQSFFTHWCDFSLLWHA
jgi:transposase